MGGCGGGAKKGNSYTPKKMGGAGAKKSGSKKSGGAGSYGNSGAFGSPKVRMSFGSRGR